MTAARAYEEEDQHNQKPASSRPSCWLDGIDREPHQGRCGHKMGAPLHRRQDAVIQLLGFFLNSSEAHLRLLAAEHEDHAFTESSFFWKPNSPSAGALPNRHFADVANSHRERSLLFPTTNFQCLPVFVTRPRPRT